MIKINLATKKQPGLAGPSGGGGAGAGGGKFDFAQLIARFKSLDPEMFKDLPVKKVVPPLVIAVTAWFVFESYKDAEIKKVNDRVVLEQAKMPALEKKAKKIKTYEDLKKEIDRDEQTIRTKIDTIQKLIAGRGEPAKMLVVLSKSIPDDVWLSNFALTQSDIAISGLSDGFGPISDLMKNLGETAYFSDLELRGSSKAQGYPSGDVTQFELTAKRR